MLFVLLFNFTYTNGAKDKKNKTNQTYGLVYHKIYLKLVCRVTKIMRINNKSSDNYSKLALYPCNLPGGWGFQSFFPALQGLLCLFVDQQFALFPQCAHRPAVISFRCRYAAPFLKIRRISRHE